MYISISIDDVAVEDLPLTVTIGQPFADAAEPLGVEGVDTLAESVGVRMLSTSVDMGA